MLFVHLPSGVLRSCPILACLEPHVTLTSAYSVSARLICLWQPTVDGTSNQMSLLMLPSSDPGLHP